MSKRSVRRARARAEQQRRASPPQARSTAATPTTRRTFWLGVVACAAVMVPLAVIAVLLVGGEDGDTSAAAPATSQEDSIQREAAALRRQSAMRDKEQIQDLTTRTRAMVEDFGPAITGLGRALPPDRTSAGPVAGRGEVESWLRPVRAADAYFEESPSGETATNVARGAFSSAVDVLLEAVETYKLALEQPAARPALLERARRQRDLAARTWSTAATQLDAINIDAGFGHQHVTFPSSAGPGAVPPDSLPEGTDAEPR